MAETRITGGEFRGRIIGTPKGSPLRPTRSLVREALFNILGGEADGAVITDLYAGAGSVGFEALSRGAAEVIFVERHRPALALIEETARRFGCLDRCRFVPVDVVTWVRGQGARIIAAADICFLDAPYKDDGADRALELIGAAPPPLVVCEHHHQRRIAERIGSLTLTRQARYGLTTLSFLRPTGETE